MDPLIGQAVVERIVAAANTAPSAENCQPWTFHWDGEALSIRRDDARARHALDRNDHASTITLGCLIEAMEIAASALGLHAEVRVRPSGPSGSTWAAARFAPSDGGAHELAEALGLRATDRRLYRGGSLGGPMLAAIREDGRRFSGARLHVSGRPSEELRAYLALADGYIWRHREVYLDILRWVRFSPEEVERTRDGASWRCLGLGLPDLPGMRLSRSPHVHAILERLGVPALSRAWVGRQIASAAALLAITVRTEEITDLVEVGRLGLLLWLRLNRAGYGVQPLSVQSLSVYDSVVGGLPASTRPEFVDLFGRGRDLLARSFGYPREELPVWLFRTGLSTSLPEVQQTRRLPLASIFTSTSKGSLR